MVLGQITSKYGMSIIEKKELFFNVPKYWFYLAIGYVLLIIRGVVWVFSLKKINLSVAYPILSLSIVIVMIVSNIMFNEIITTGKIIGSVLIVSGVSLLSVKS
jgi:drug/metabolite transporter (DMT)-like permease